MSRSLPIELEGDGKGEAGGEAVVMGALPLEDITERFGVIRMEEDGEAFIGKRPYLTGDEEEEGII